MPTSLTGWAVYPPMIDGFYFDARKVGEKAEQGVHGPILGVTVHLKVSTGGSGDRIDIPFTDKEARVELSHIEAFLFWNPRPGHAWNWPELVSIGFPKSMRLSSLVMDKAQDVPLELLFPLTPTMLSQMEDSRPDDKVRYAVTLRATGWLIHTPGPGPELLRVPFVANSVEVAPQDRRGLVLEVERSKWVEEILPDLGVGRFMVYEVPLENFEGVEQVDTYLRNAVRQYLAHEWKLSMAASRDVVESLERELQASASPVYTDKFGTAAEKVKDVREAYGKLVTAMLDFQAATKSLFAAGAHPERPEEFVERPDAELALNIAFSIRRYVGMRLRATKPPSFAPSTADGAAGA